jgi:hypothetical protein
MSSLVSYLLRLLKLLNLLRVIIIIKKQKKNYFLIQEKYLI